jgi:hypothetical protein
MVAGHVGRIGLGPKYFFPKSIYIRQIKDKKGAYSQGLCHQ